MPDTVNLAQKLATFGDTFAPRTVHLLLMEKSGPPNSGDPTTAAPRRFA